MSLRRAAALTLIAAGGALSVLAAHAAQSVDVIQVGRAFSTRELAVQRGDVVRFVNSDKFLHQVYVDAPTFKITTNEQEPGETIAVPFTVAGVFAVRCEIHPKMLLTVTVR